MPGPSWLAYGLAGILAATALYYATHFILAIRLDRAAHFDVDIVHTVMGTVMVATLVGAVHLGSSPPWAVTFAVMALWFVWRSLHAYVLDGGGAPAIGHYAPATPTVPATRLAVCCELAMSVAMGYLLLMMW